MTTIDYYNQNASEFAENTMHVSFEDTQKRFLKYLPINSKILDFGCGAGRDSKYFLEKGYDVIAIDGSEELCKIASKNIGIPVKHLLFQELEDVNQYDGIWACSSILHLSKKELKEVIYKMIAALKTDGIIYTSFKYGEFEGLRNGRFFTDFTTESFEQYMENVKGVIIEQHWITGDVRPGRGEEKWLNLILRKR